MNRAIVLLWLALATSSASAATTCRLVAVGSILFGSYEVFASAPHDSLVSVTVTCDRSGGPQSVPVVMRLSAGQYAASANARRMLHVGGSGDYLAYGLYRDVARNSVWGSADNIDTMSTTLSVPNNDSASTSFTIYGRIPALQNVTAGNYSDAVQVTIVF